MVAQEMNSNQITCERKNMEFPFQFLHELSQSSPALITPLGPHHDILLLSNSMTSTHKDRALPSTFPASSTSPPTPYSTTTTPLPPPPPQPPPDPPSPPDWCVRCLLITESPKTPGHYRYLIWVLCPASPPDCVETDPKKNNRKRSQSHSRTPQKQRDKKKPPKLKKITTANQYTKPFNCYTIHIRGLTP